MRLILKGGAPILAMTAAMSAQPYIDALILSRLAPGNVVGWFGAARNILGTIMAPATILGVAAYPRLARAFTEPFPALRREATSALRTIFILGCLAATGTYLFASTAVGLVYGTAGFGPAATVLKVFSPGLLLVFIDIVLGTIVYACGGATGFAIAKILSVAASAGLDLLLIPVFQARFGNGGIGAVVAFGASEVIVFAGALLVVPRGALSAMDLLDLLRALAAGGATILLFRVLGDITPFLAIPLCVVVFLVASLSMGLIRRSDVAEIARRIRAWLASRIRGSRVPRTPPADVGPAPRGTARPATVKPPAEPRPVETCVLQFPESETGGER